MVMAAEADAGRYSAGPDSTLQLRLLPFSKGRAGWNELLNSFPEATIYHRDSWLQLLVRAYGLSLWLATLQRSDSVVAGCVFARAPLSRRFVSLSFSDSCPPLTKEPGADRQLLSALVAQAPSRSSYEVRGIGGVAGWETVECFATWRLGLDRPLARIEKGLAANFRRNLRHASPTTIKIDHGSGIDLVKRFYVMQVESRRRLGLPAQPWRFFELAREIFAADGNFEVWLASENGEDVASAVFMGDGDVIHYKWGARRLNHRSNANHLLFWNAIEEFAPRARFLDLGRADVRNKGLMRFKAELGASVSPLPSSFYPRAPRHVSAEVLTGGRAILAGILSRMPVFATRMAGRVAYRFLG
ncbi:MAG TPA: GNAT family N-acetyltransferase [Candidatus Binataceae bacterium]